MGEKRFRGNSQKFLGMFVLHRIHPRPKQKPENIYL